LVAWLLLNVSSDHCAIPTDHNSFEAGTAVEKLEGYNWTGIDEIPA
jgi:hypothetical protein